MLCHVKGKSYFFLYDVQVVDTKRVRAVGAANVVAIRRKGRKPGARVLTMADCTHRHVMRAIGDSVKSMQRTCINCPNRTSFICVGCALDGMNTGVYCESTCFWIYHSVRVVHTGHGEVDEGKQLGPKEAAKLFPVREVVKGVRGKKRAVAEV
jgi:hypothetical protein